MTAIAAIKHDGKVYIGADSAGVSGWDLTVRADSKVFTNGPFVMGFTSSFRMGQLLRYSFVPPPHPDGVDINRYMVTLFVDEARRVLKEGGFVKTDSGREDGGVFIVGYRGRIFSIFSDFQVSEAVDDFAAAGSGENQVLGALFATSERRPRQRLQVALSAAERFCASVRGPFHIEREP